MIVKRLAAGLVLAVVLAACGSSGDDDGNGDGDGGEDSTTSSAAVDEAVSAADCLVGEWTADVPTFIEGFSGYLERVGGPELGGITGTANVSYDGSNFVSTFDEWTVTLLLAGTETVVTTNGESSGAYSVTDEVVTATDVVSNLEVTGFHIIDGVTTDLGAAGAETFFEANFFADPLPFDCEDDVLVYEIVVPELDESFTENMTRIG